MGSAMIGTVIRRASTTETTGGGGIRSASIRDEQPAIVTEAQAIPRASPARDLGLVSLSSNMIALLHKRVGANRAVPRPRLTLPAQGQRRPHTDTALQYGSERPVKVFLSKVTVRAE